MVVFLLRGFFIWFSYKSFSFMWYFIFIFIFPTIFLPLHGFLTIFLRAFFPHPSVLNDLSCWTCRSILQMCLPHMNNSCWNTWKCKKTLPSHLFNMTFICFFSVNKDTLPSAYKSICVDLGSVLWISTCFVLPMYSWFLCTSWRDPGHAGSICDE